MVYKKHTLLIDINAWGYAGQQATKLTSGGMETQAAFTVFKTLHEVRESYDRYTPIVLWDGRAQWRYDLYPGYKGNRNSDPVKIAMKAAYATQKPFIERALEHLGVRQMTAFSHEADDLAGIFVCELSADPEHHIVLQTGDQDWIQFVRRNVSWCDLRDPKRRVSAANFYEYTGCKTPLEFIERKCLMGDSSDTITGVGGIGKETAPDFIAEFGSVREFWRRCDAGEHTPRNKAERSLWKGESPYTRKEWAPLFQDNPEWDGPTRSKAIKKHMEQWPGQGRLLFRRNFQLMQLLKVAPPKPADIKLVPGKFNKEEFAKVCEELAFISILRDLDNFCRPFEAA